MLAPGRNRAGSLNGNCRQILVNYLNFGAVGRLERTLSCPFVSFLHRINARRVAARMAKACLAAEPAGSRRTRLITVEPYSGSNPVVQRMIDYLAANLEEDLVAAVLHGSLGTYEEIEYSDFDGLLIIKNEVLASASRLSRFARLLRETSSIMARQDILQHHGWFVVTENELTAFPIDYFPLELFKHAKVMIPREGIDLHVRPQTAFRASFEALESHARNLCWRAESSPPRNVFLEKSLLSQVMLVPTLFCQARDGIGVFKRESFASAKPSFPARVWSVIDDASSVRSSWSYQPTWLGQHLLKRAGPCSNIFAKKILRDRMSVLPRDFLSGVHRLGLWLLDQGARMSGTTRTSARLT